MPENDFLYVLVVIITTLALPVGALTLGLSWEWLRKLDQMWWFAAGIVTMGLWVRFYGGCG